MNEPISVLVAEDVGALRDHFAKLISGQSDMVLAGTACNGAEAVQLATTHCPHVALMDIEMAEKRDGIRAILEIVQSVPSCQLVVLTVHDDDETVFSAFKAGAVDYILKGGTPDEVLEAVRAAAAGTSPIRPAIATKIRREFRRLSSAESAHSRAVDLAGQLTPTELQVLERLANGSKQVEIAEALCVEVSTVKTHVHNIIHKFRARTGAEAAKMGRELGLI